MSQSLESIMYWAGAFVQNKLTFFGNAVSQYCVILHERSRWCLLELFLIRRCQPDGNCVPSIPFLFKNRTEIKKLSRIFPLLAFAIFCQHMWNNDSMWSNVWSQKCDFSHKWEKYSSFSRYAFLSDLADLTDLEMEFYFLLLYVSIIWWSTCNLASIGNIK